MSPLSGDLIERLFPLCPGLYPQGRDLLNSSFSYCVGGCMPDGYDENPRLKRDRPPGNDHHLLRAALSITIRKSRIFRQL